MVGRMSRDLSDIKDWYQKLLKGSRDFTKKGSSKPQEKTNTLATQQESQMQALLTTTVKQMPQWKHRIHMPNQILKFWLSS